MRNLDLPRSWLAHGTLLFSHWIWVCRNVYECVSVQIPSSLICHWPIAERPVEMAAWVHVDCSGLVMLLHMSTFSSFPNVFSFLWWSFSSEGIFPFFGEGRGSHFMRITAKTMSRWKQSHLERCIILVYWLAPAKQLRLYRVWVLVWCLRCTTYDIHNWDLMKESKLRILSHES